MLTSLVLAGAMLVTPHVQDKWDIKAGLAPNASNKYAVNTTVSLQGEEHTATLNYVFATKAAEDGKPLAATVSWNDLTLESGQSMPDSSWDVTLDPHGMIVGAPHNEDLELDRKSLSPYLFPYPEIAVGVGDTWTVTTTGGTSSNDTSITAEMKADSMDKVGDVDAMKVTETLTQKGDDGLKCTSSWWVDKTGKVLKFDVTFSNWEVSMLPGTMLDGHMKGELAK